jgi:FkbM family methyltransferase
MPLNEPQTKFITLSNGKASVVLMCPFDHKLDTYLNTYPLYDRRLPILARIVSENYPDSTFLDIGANIGDTIALLRLGGCELHVIGIEPSRVFFSFLKTNIEKNKSFFGKTTIHHAFIGKPGEILHLVEANGTAHITKSTETDEPADVVEVFDLHKFENETISALKIDTDGYDSYIVNENRGYLKKNAPILWVA